jgi:HNH endonuclease
MVTKAELERFNSKFIIEDGYDGCHLWQGALDRDGYGSFYFRKKLRRAHRVAYFIHVGEIPNGMFVDHICKNRNCVKASHLRLVTPRQNALENSRAVSARNAMKTHCKNGHPFDKVYGKQRYCSICQNEKRARLRKKWKAEADAVKC